MQGYFNKKYITGGGIIVLLIIIVLGVYYFKQSGHSSSVGTGVSATSSTTTAGGVGVSGTGGYSIKVLPVNVATTPAPNFRTPIIPPASMSPDAQAALQANFIQVESVLATSSTDFDSWIELGTLRKIAGDYAGAAADWEYISAIYPTNNVSFANLGDLYTNFLPNYPKAASAYEEEIVNDSTDPDAYEDLFSLFTNQYAQGTTTPTNVLKQGIALNPQSLDLYVTLARYYGAQGDSADAKIEYNKAIAVAQAQGNTEAASELQQEEAAL